MNMSSISVCVISHNSESTILDTLNSVFYQSYRDIELIISDDCSTDKTIEICHNWEKNYASRFSNFVIVSSSTNKGVAANCNQALRRVSSEWIKFIAGDDALLPNCLSDNIRYVAEQKFNNVLAVHSNVAYYKENFNLENHLGDSILGQLILGNEELNARDQLLLFVRRMVPMAPAFFLNAEILRKLNLFDESLPYEDGPLCIKLAENGIKFHFLNIVTVKYRIHNSLSNSGSDFIFKSIYKKEKLVFDKLLKPHLTKVEIMAYVGTYKLKNIFSRFNFTPNSNLTIISYRVLNFPFYLIWLLSLKISIIYIRIRIWCSK